MHLPSIASRRLLALVAATSLCSFAALATAARPAPSPSSPAPQPGRAGARLDEPTSAAWVASGDGPWRLPLRGGQVGFLDARRAVVTAFRSIYANSLMTIDLGSGAVSEPVEVMSEGAEMQRLLRIGNRLLAFGVEDNLPAAWQLGGDPIAATAIAVPAGVVGRPADDSPQVLASPDERWIVWCSESGPPTVRDPDTLRVLHQLNVLSCRDARFVSPSRVVLGGQQVELTTGAVSAAEGKPIVYAGPRQRVLTVEGEYLQSATVQHGGRVVQQRMAFDGQPRWTPDGVAIVRTRDALSLRPGPGGEPRTMRPRLDSFSLFTDFVVSAQHAILLDGHSVELIDLRTGEHRYAAGNLSSADDVAALGDTVASASDRLRLWRGGKLVAEEELEATVVRAAGDRLAIIDDARRVWLWSPAGGLLRHLGKLDRLFDAMLWTRDDDVWFATSYTLEHSKAGAPARPIARFRNELTVAAFDPQGKLALLEESELLHLADLTALQRRGQPAMARTWKLEKNCSVLVDGFGYGRLVLHAGSDVYVIDPEGVRPTLSAELPYFDGVAMTIKMGGEVVMASGDKLVVWRAGEPDAAVWQMPVPAGTSPSSVRISPDGENVAVGTSMGAVVRVPLAEARAAPRVAVNAPSSPCVLGAPKATSFASLGLERPAGPKATPNAAPPAAPKAAHR